MSETSEDNFVKFLSETGTKTDSPKKPYNHSNVSRVECIFSAILDGVRLSKYAAVDNQFEKDVAEFKTNIEVCEGAYKPTW